MKREISPLWSDRAIRGLNAEVANMRRRKWIIVLLAVIVLLAGAGLAYAYLKPATNQAQTAIVRRGTIEASITTLGRVQPKRQINLSVPMNGQVKRVLVQEGDLVGPGTVLLELDAQDVTDAVAQAERGVKVRKLQLDEGLQAPDSATIDLARARLRAATAARLKAQKDYDKVADKPNAESTDEALKLETAKVEYEVAKAEFDHTLQGQTTLQIERLRTDLSDAQVTLSQAQERLAQTRMIAPITGTVMSIDPRLGEHVYAFAPLIRLADLSRLEIRAEIDEIDIASVAPGQHVQIRLDAFPAQTLNGQIVRLLPGPSDTRGTTTYGCLIDYEGSTLPIRTGMGANLTITTKVAENAFIIPRSAVRQVGRHQVVRVLAGRRLNDTAIITGLSNESAFEVLSGLEEGQVVLLN
jgi:RND family efflux transporter MFP subunit